MAQRSLGLVGHRAYPASKKRAILLTDCCAEALESRALLDGAVTRYSYPKL